MRLRSFQPVDYWRKKQERRKLTNYLKAGNFKKISGSPVLTMDVLRRRYWLGFAAIVVLLVGIFFVII